MAFLEVCIRSRTMRRDFPGKFRAGYDRALLFLFDFIFVRRLLKMIEY
jgi:hypothetical protein